MRRVKRGEAEQTIVDLTDNRKLIVMVSTSKARQIIYNPNNGTYTPDFSKEPMVLTPELYITGSSTNVIATAETVKWYVRPNTLGQRIPIENNDTYKIGNDFKLTISKNIMKDMLTMEFIVEVVYKEPDSDFRTTIPHHMELINISMGENGRNGVDGLDGLDGERGLPGPKGADGESSYTHLAYANDATGTQDFSLSDSNRSYIGMYVDNLENDSTNPSDYKWTKVEGMPGDKGVQGPKGKDGRTPYFHIAYATSEDGVDGFSVSDSVGKTYIGQYTDYIETDSTKHSDYSWTKIKGADGRDGVAGKNGVGVSNTAITYAQSSSGTTAPSTGYTSTVPSLTKGKYLWTKTVWTYSDKTTETGYSVAYIAKDGNNGSDGIAGKDGVGIETTTITYAKSTSGTVKPTTGYTATIPAVANGQYLWTKTTWTYTDNTTEDGYSVAKMGEKGADGVDSATLAIITPDGTTVRDTTNSLRLESKLFVGGKETTASSYKWYYSNGSSTVTHSTGKNTSVGATIIKNSLPIFLDATYNGTTYTSSVTINDISDVYTSIILGVSTFKNGKGSNTYTVKLYRNGEEIDPGGSIYSYEWEKLNSQGVKDTRFTKTGKTITINASEIDNTNLFNCYIYTK